MQVKEGSDLIAKCLKDENFKEEFKKNPKAVLEKEYDKKLPEDLEVKVVEDTLTLKHVVIPCMEKGELSHEESESLAGGSATLPWADLHQGAGQEHIPHGDEPIPDMDYRKKIIQ